MVVVFTKYDRLLISKMLELGLDNESQGIEVANKVCDNCVESLKSVVSGMNPPIPMPIYVTVSGIIFHSFQDRCHG